MEKKASPKKSTSKKTQVKTATKAAPKKKTQVVKTQKKSAPKKTQVVKTQKKETLKNFNKKDANTGYLLGLTSLVAWVIPVVGAIVTVSGIYCCYKGMKSRKGVAMLGLILNILFLALALVNINADFAMMN